MQQEQLPDHIVYSPAVIEFVTVVAETCLLLENAASQTRMEFIDRSVKMLPLLYLKASLIKIPEAIFDDAPERFVSEDDYLFIKEQIEQILGSDDSYLEVFHPDMAISDTPIAAFVSEDMADVYQEIKDFAANYQTLETEIMNDALVACIEAFAQHWGQKNLNALKALHSIRYSDSYNTEEQDETINTHVNRNSFLNFLHDEEDDDVTNRLL